MSSRRRARRTGTAKRGDTTGQLVLDGAKRKSGRRRSGDQRNPKARRSGEGAAGTSHPQR